MKLALRLARRAQGATSPNPMVGAVVVSQGRIVGQGYHRRAGLPHAEVDALRRAGHRARGGTLYVTLEPCNHTGRTPPCCDAILAAGLSRVVIATRDPNPLTDGRGIAHLRRAGVRVTTGALASEARALNEPFEKVMRRGLPWVVVKVGQSLDGRIATATGQSRWITSAASRRLAHQWRRQVDAILVGINTVRQDDPLLTARGLRRRMGPPARQGGGMDRPIKVVVDSGLRMPLDARCLSAQSPAPTIIATTVRRRARQARFTRRGIEVWPCAAREGRVRLTPLCRALARRGIHRVLIEGGGEVVASALKERLVDHLVFFTAPILIGGRSAPGSVGGSGIRRLAQAIRVKELRVRRVGTDLCLEGRVVYPARGDQRPATSDKRPR